MSLVPVHEYTKIKSTAFPLFDPRSSFTDDTVLTIATAQAILSGTSYETAYRDFGRKYPSAGYGGLFLQWLRAAQPRPYNSWGNGSAMRVSPVGWAFDSIDEVLDEAERSASVTHNHPEGVKGAQATALAVFLARSGRSKEMIRDEVARRFDYDLARSIDAIRPVYDWDVSCQGCVPEAIIAFMESTDVESAIRLAISLGGDADTLAAITGGIAHAFYRHVPDSIVGEVRRRLPAEFLAVIDEFEGRFGPAEAGHYARSG